MEIIDFHHHQKTLYIYEEEKLKIGEDRGMRRKVGKK
jgi:hypothetical protein